ncbi:MAG: hypothetical protein AAGD13_20320 [Pseudomonadota bacterium]
MTDAARICVLGNSHLAAMKSGWDLISDHTDGYELTFFGAPKAMMDGLVLEGSKLVPQNDKLKVKLRVFSGGSEMVDLNAYDAFVVVGLQFGPRRIAQLYRSHRPVGFEWREPLSDLAPMAQREDHVTAVSERLFLDALVAGLTDTMAVRLIEDIQSVTERPIYLVSAPFFSELALETGDWDTVIGAGDVTRLAQRYRKFVRHAVPSDVTLIMPPNRMIRHGFFTAKEFAVPELDDGFQDLVHANPEYGASMLRSVLASMRKSSVVRNSAAQAA